MYITARNTFSAIGNAIEDVACDLNVIGMVVGLEAFSKDVEM